MTKLTHQLAHDERGATVIEYALVAALIAVALSASFTSVGSESRENFEKVDTEYQSANP